MDTLSTWMPTTLVIPYALKTRIVFLLNIFIGGFIFRLYFRKSCAAALKTVSVLKMYPQLKVVPRIYSILPNIIPKLLVQLLMFHMFFYRAIPLQIRRKMTSPNKWSNILKDSCSSLIPIGPHSPLF